MLAWQAVVVERKRKKRMPPENIVYDCAPVDGLPASLLKWEGKTIAAVALMQRKADLNRARRKRLEAHFKSGGAPPRFLAKLTKTDWAVLTSYTAGTFRFLAFWDVARAYQASIGKERYAHAIDIQLLASYDAAWLGLPLDEAVLLTTCPVWKEIREGVSARLKDRSHKAPLGIFMLWPRLLEDLKQWAMLDAARQMEVGHAVFALSTAGYTHWFIEQAIAICPDLQTELGAIGRLIGTADTEEVSAGGVADVAATERGHLDDELPLGYPPQPLWDNLLARMDELAHELRLTPSREAVMELVALVSELECFGPSLPRRHSPALTEVEAHRDRLVAHLRTLSGRAGFEWLEEALVTQLDARWTLALRACADDEHRIVLGHDAEAALLRTGEAAVACLSASEDLAARAEERRAFAEKLGAAQGYAERASAYRRHLEARKLETDAESAKLSMQERLVDAASPFAEPFDYASDYVALTSAVAVAESAPVEVQGPGKTLEGDSLNPGALTPAVVTTDEKVDSTLDVVSVAALSSSDEPNGDVVGSPESSAAETQTGEDAMLGGSGTPEFVADEPMPLPADPADPVDAVACTDGTLTDGEGSYSEQAGLICQPIWHLIGAGEVALAHHAARWIEDVHPGVRVPPPDLLAAAAFADELMLADGPVQTALAARLTALVEADYVAAASPAAWHTAINLLLVAATLRPMVLAPGTGAASVASYLHQDGHYPALYALVQKLRALSARLVGFPIEPGVLRRARGEAATRADIEALQRTAGDWLRVQAPAYTIRFAPATAVWKQWIRPGGDIETLVSPVVHNKLADAERVRENFLAMSGEAHVHRLIHETDRKTLKRMRGDDIHASAFDHLVRLVDEALTLPRQWLGLVDLLGGKGDRLRTLLEEVHVALRDSKDQVEHELHRIPGNDAWGLIEGSQRQVLRALERLLALFDGAPGLPDVERSPAEVLGRGCLRVAGLPVSETWNVELDSGAALAQLTDMGAELEDAGAVLRQRVDRGDLLGAQLMVETGFVEAATVQLRADRDRWKSVLRRELAESRRSVEIGSAYGYVPDAERGDIETQLARCEAQLDEERRFDLAMDKIRQTRVRVESRRDDRKREVRAALREIALSEDMHSGAADVEAALAEGDIATANELVHWLQQGKPVPADLDEDVREGFAAFFPEVMKAIHGWLGDKNRGAIEGELADGIAIPGLDALSHDETHRQQGVRIFGDWSEMKGRNHVDERFLSQLLSGLGLTVKSLKVVERSIGGDVFALESAPIEDRHLCVLPTFGSSAAGRYRVVCVRGRPTEDELVQWAGDPSGNRPTLLIYLGRMAERKWRDLSRVAKTKQRSFLFLDETLLVFLCSVGGSRLRNWFDAALPFSYAFPYDAAAGLVPPEMFYGRSTELEAVRGLNGRCFIYGGRQLGKTALLKRAEQSFHRPAREQYAKWIDLRAEGIGVSLAAGEIWVTLLDRFKEMHIVDAKLSARDTGKRQRADSVIRAIREFVMANPDRRVLLLLDEADRFFEQDGRNDFAETRRLKQLMDDTERRFKVVFAGLHNVLRMTERPNHPLAHFGEPIEIGPLHGEDEVREAANLIRRPMAAAGFAFASRGLVIRILAQTNYYPSLIQLYCSHLMKHMLAQVTGTRATPHGPRYMVTDRDIEQVYSSDALRLEIRAKFRLTLQLDPRYEVLAHAMALALLRGQYSQTEGMPWQTIRQSGAMHWWAEGFHDTSELDFRVLLDEMVGLGVLRQRAAGRYVLRNPNVLLLLGTQDEIETVLNKEREPAVEFESASFRPPMRAGARNSRRNVFTYQQLSKLLQRTNGITVVTGTMAAGIDGVVADLQDYLDTGVNSLVMPDCADRQAFGHSLQKLLVDRPKDQVSVFIVPDSMPWTDLWLEEAKSRVDALRSDSKFASVVFVAEPATLWRLLRDGEQAEVSDLPWMSLLHWNDAFLRHWLEECRVSLEQEDRRRLATVTGLWPGLIYQVAADCEELRVVKDRLAAADATWPTPGEKDEWRLKLGLEIAEPRRVLAALASWNEALSVEDIAELCELPVGLVDTALRWAELLGLARREGAGFWLADTIVAKVLSDDRP